MAQTTNAFTATDYQCGANTGAHGNKYEQDLAFVMFERCTLVECNFKLATEMIDAGKFDDVILHVDHLKEVWLFQAKHSISSEDQVSRRDLFPDDQRYEGKDFDLYKYVKSYFYVEQSLKTDSVDKHYFIFTNKSLEENDELKKWVDISNRKVDKLMDYSKFGASYKGFKPKDDKIITIIDKVNMDFLALKLAIITLLETGKVEQILNDYKTPLTNILEVAGNCLKFSDTFSENNGDLSQKKLHTQLQTHFQQKSLQSISKESNKAIKDLLKGRSRNVQLPPFVDAKFVAEFFDRLTFCLNQPSDLRTIADDDLRLWLRGWIRPDDLGRFGESQTVLPRVKLDEVFKSWNEPNMSKGQNKSKDKSFLSQDTGKKCVQDITNELKQFVSKHSDALDRYYVNRFLKAHEPELDNQNPVSDEDFVKQLEENVDQMKCTILIAEPGMGKTTLLQHIGFEIQKRSKRDVYLIYLKNIDQNLKINDNTDVKEIVSNMFKDILSITGLEAFKNNLEKHGNSILVLFDGFDEIASSQVGNIFTLLQRLQKIQKLQLIISGRKHVQESLEQKLSLNNSKLVVVNLIPFMYAEQRKFLESFWNIPSDQEADDDWEGTNKKFDIFSTLLLHKFHSDIGRVQYNFTGLPLMIRMLAEIHTDIFFKFLESESDDTREIFTAGKFSVLKLFEKFVEISFNMKTKKKYGQEAYSIVEPFDKEDDDLETLFDKFVLEHQLIAIRQLAVVELNHVIDVDKYFKINARILKRIKTGYEKSLLINFTSDENPVEFVHLSYAEYFVAKYLFDNAHGCLESLFHILEMYEVVRRFFFSQIEENFDSNLNQLMIVDKICNTQPDVAFWACEGSCVKVVKKLLENRDFRTKQNFNDTLLHVAVKVDCSALVSYLLYEHGMEVDVKPYHKGTPLHLASEKGHLEIAMMLIDASAEIENTNSNRQTPLHLAVDNGHIEFTRMLLSRSANVHVKDHNKDTPLHDAAKRGHLKIAKMLIDESAKVEVTNVSKRTPLHLAAKNNYPELVLMLIEQLPIVKAQDKQHQLSTDLTDGNIHVLNALIDRFTIGGVEDAVGSSLLNLAINNGYFEYAKIMIGQFEKINDPDINEMTPLLYAAKKGIVDIAKLLIDQSANAEVGNHYGETPLHLAAKYGRLEMAKYLVVHSANIEAQDKYKQTPLYLAAEHGHFETFKMLLENSANVIVKNKNGRTPLHEVVEKNHLEIAKILLEHSPDVDRQVDIYGNTPLHVAAERGHMEITKMLIAQSTDVEVQNKDGKTPLHLAAEGGRWELLVMLIDQLPNVAAHLKHQLSMNSAAGNKNIFKLLIERITIDGVLDKVGRSLLHLAIKRGIFDLATWLIEQSGNVDDRDNFNNSPIHIAAAEGNQKITKMLIDQSANIDAQDNDGQTPLHIALQKNHLEIAKMLLENSANVDIQNNAGKTSLYNALSLFNKNDKIVKLMLEHSTDVNAQVKDGQTPLHLTAKNGYLETAKMLIAQSADVEVQNKDGKTPLHLAAEGGHLELVLMLIDQLPNVSAHRKKHQLSMNLVAGKKNIYELLIEQFTIEGVQDKVGRPLLNLAVESDDAEFAMTLIKQSVNVDDADNYNNSPIHLAAAKGNLKIIKMLIDQSANIDAQDDDDQTPLQIAVKENHLETAKMLIEHSADVNVQSIYGLTPLHNACYANRNDEFAKLLIDHSADVNVQENLGVAPLHLAVKNNHLKLTNMLIDHSADVNVQENQGRTPLHLAVKNNHLKLTKLLIDHSADVNAHDNKGRTPLHMVAKSEYYCLQVAKMLIEHSADVNAQENDGQTPLHMAAYSKYYGLEVSKMLIDHSANINAQKNNGKTPLHLAAEHDNLEIVKMLIDRSASVGVLDNNQQTPLQLAAELGHLEIAEALEQFV